ncbi:hypothetical protein R5R35_003015 [Gryllus longicercus]|uniref:Hemimethylated DNA-binding domain-containing protein n=1 Tax=Gryllus longicercus TaxID=2509291 RepID=A0AAN9Z9Q9_9ORTH
MPLAHREVLQLGLLFLCVPLQYLLSGHLTNRSQAILHVVNDFRHFRDNWLHTEPWKNRFVQLVSWVLKGFVRPSNPIEGVRVNGPETSLAIEVLQYRERAGFFGSSQEVRSERPKHLRFRVGQVVRHRIEGFRAVIVGWDLHAKAPESWLNLMYGESRVLRFWPHYALLIDRRDRKGSHQTYVVQEQLELMKNTEVRHPDIGKKFAYFDGAQYIPHGKLKRLYPKD